MLRLTSIVLLAVYIAADEPIPLTEPRRHPPHSATHLQHTNPLDYYLEHPKEDNYFQAVGRKRISVKEDNKPKPSPPNGHFESLEPDSEVELVSDEQQPQLPSQQIPVAPSVPGLLPGQRVFVVQMPVPGFKPNNIGGYRPLYVINSQPQLNKKYPINGYQHAVVLGHSGPNIPGYIHGITHNPNVLIAPYNQRPSELIYPEADQTGILNQQVPVITESDPLAFKGRYLSPVHRLVYLKPQLIHDAAIKKTAHNSKEDARSGFLSVM